MGANYKRHSSNDGDNQINKEKRRAIMTFWTAMVLIVAIGSVSAVYRTRIKASSGKLEELFDLLSERVDRMEERMANLETILLEREKAVKFENL